MKMAKASEDDLRMAMDVANVLDDIERGFFPYKFQEEESEHGERIDTDDRDQYERLIDGLQRLLNQGSIFRVIFGMAVVCDPANECIDPDADAIEHHPKRLIAEQQREELLAALERLSFAAARRDNTIGDQCNLIEVRAELAAANRQAMSVIASARQPSAAVVESEGGEA